MRALSAPAGPQPLARRPRGRERRRVQSTKESRRADPNRIPAHYELAKGRCRGLPRVANPRYLSLFPFSALPCVAPYCAPGGVRVVSEDRGLGTGAFADQIRRVKVCGSNVPYVIWYGRLLSRMSRLPCFCQVALEEAIDHAYPQTRFERPQIRLGELPYLLALGARPSRHFFKDLAVTAFGQ